MRPYNVIKYKPHNPTRIYTILESKVMFPKRKATRSKRKTPISNQLSAPIMTSVRLMLSNIFICVSSLFLVSTRIVSSRKRILFMKENNLYNKYSDYLKEKYGEKVYKLPINLPITCPNRINGAGCSFCAEVGTGFEALDSSVSVKEQMQKTKALIETKYKAKKYIAYFQNYTNTFMPISMFKRYILEAASEPDIVEISISTRPDCIRADYLELLLDIYQTYHININIELGLQTANYHTLDSIDRGHGLAEFIDAVLQIKKYPFTICTHIILNLPWDDMRDTIENARILSALHIDIVKLHSLYIAKNTKLSKQYKDVTITVCSKEEYIDRVIAFLNFLSPDIIVERLFSRVPEDDAEFSNWNTSWWKLQDDLTEKMRQQNAYQGKNFDYLNGRALNIL